MFEAIIIFTMVGLPADATDGMLIGGPYNSFGDCEKERIITYNSLMRNPGIEIKENRCVPVVVQSG